MSYELLGDLTRAGKLRRPSRVALVWRDQETSYLTLDGQIESLAAGLIKRGLRPGDCVALYTHNLPHFVTALYAIQRAGAVAAPLSIYWQGRDLLYLLQTCRASGVITIAPYYERIAALQADLPHLRWVAAITPDGAGDPPDGALGWSDLAGEPLAETAYPNLDPLDPALLAFTGGRSGPARPVLHSHFNLLANCQQMQDLPLAEFLSDLEEDDEDAGFRPASPARYERVLLPLPLFNLFSLNLGLNLTLRLGGTAVLMERFDPRSALELIERRACTTIFGSPAVFSELVHAPQVAGRLDSVRLAFSYGDRLDPSVAVAWLEQTGRPLFECYGLTEAGPLLCCQAAGRTFEAATLGPALPLVGLFAAGPDGSPVPAGQVGELLARGPNLMLGYYGPDGPGQAAGLTEGWLATGDLGLQTPEGNFRVLDRREDALVLPDGRLIIPRDIEEVLNRHPGLAEAAALPYTSPDGRSRMVAFVVVRQPGPGLSEPQLLRYCERHLPAPLGPERVLIYRQDRLPRLPNGALWRRALRAKLPEYL